MKLLSLSFFSFLFSLTVCHAEIKFPKGSYEGATLEQALEQANKDKKPVAYILTKKIPPARWRKELPKII